MCSTRGKERNASSEIQDACKEYSSRLSTHCRGEDMTDEELVLEFYEGVYNDLAWQIKPHVDANLLPASVVESMEFLIEFYLKHKDKQ